MAPNNINKHIFLTVLILLFASLMLYAEDELPVSGYEIRDDGTQIRIFQHLVWEKEEHAVRYEVEIQVYRNNEYVRFDRIETTDQIYTVSLPPGRYRYRVTPIDLLRRRGETSEWRELPILTAFQPVINRVSPVEFFLDLRAERIITITGENFIEGETSEIYLFKGDVRINPEKITFVDTQTIVVVFNDRELIEGTFDLYVQNPGGLAAVFNGFYITYRKPFDFFLKAAFMPVYPIYGEMYNYFGFNPFLRGGFISLEVTSSKQGYLNSGVEFHVSSAYLNDIGDGVLITDILINLVLQFRFNHRRNAFTFRFGCGVSFIDGFGNYEMNDATINMGLGASFLFLFYGNFYLEMGVNYSHYLTINDPFGLLKPWVGIVLQF
ncbi:MAG: hypothetical protein FWD28_03370 [Treponema sp.]|nr:hypothetical protein [Treponema sp.]